MRTACLVLMMVAAVGASNLRFRTREVRRRLPESPPLKCASAQHSGDHTRSPAARASLDRSSGLCVAGARA